MLKRFPSSSWSEPQAAHLLNRAGFGGSPAEIAAFQKLGLEGAVNKVIKGEEDDDLFPPPPITQPKELVEMMQNNRAIGDPAEKRKAQQEDRRQQAEEIRNLRVWWLNRMRYTPNPFREKMTLFWHGHFATSVEKVRSSYLMWQQNETLRANGLGNFHDLVKEVSKDPAMMRYLDTNQSAKQKPNENFARELMELFTLGEGVVYTEQDIKESARAFTGYRINPMTMSYFFARRNFDDSEKTFMGRKGPFTGDDVVDIIVAQPQSSEYIVKKLWKFFASDKPNDYTVKVLAQTFRDSGYNIAATMKEMFLSDEFYAPATMRSQVKSPIQWLVQTSRVLEAPLPSMNSLENSMAQMGQVLFRPPNVKGWDGGRAWISSSTLLFRYNLAGYLVSGKAPALDGFNRRSGSIHIPLEKIAPPETRGDPAKLCDTVALRLLGAPIQGESRERLMAFLKGHPAPTSDAVLRDFLHLMMSTPEYQLT